MAITTSQITITTMEGWYSGATPPLNPLIGDLWLDTTSNEIKKYDGTNWIKQADTQGPPGPQGDSMVSREAYWIKSSIKPEESDKPDPEMGDMKGWIKGSEPPESALDGIQPSDKFWRIYKETYSNGESEYSKYSEVELIGSYEVLNGLVQFRNGVTTTENDVTVIDGGKIHTKSIEADKIKITDLSALDATIGGFHIGKSSIYSGAKSTIDNSTRGIYIDTDSQVYFGDDTNFIKYYKDQNGDYQLDITANTVRFGTSATTIEEAIEDIKNESVTDLRIESSKGTVFKNNLISTVLSVIIHHGSQRITDYATMISTFGPNAYLQWKWQRIDEEDYHIISSDDSRITNNGFTFTLNAEDVDTKVTFMCELIESAENIKASGLITLSVFENIESVTRYYKLQDSSLEAPSKPTVDTLSEWSTTEPPYESSKLLYYCDITTLSTGEWIASEVSVSGVYQTLQDAYDKIDENDKLIQSWCSENDQTKISGGSIYMDKAFADSIFSNDITAKNTITGAKLISGSIEGAKITTNSGKIGPFEITPSGLKGTEPTKTGLSIPFQQGTYTGKVQIGEFADEATWGYAMTIRWDDAGGCGLDPEGLFVGETWYGSECQVVGDLSVDGTTYTSGNINVHDGYGVWCKNGIRLVQIADEKKVRVGHNNGELHLFGLGGPASGGKPIRIDDGNGLLFIYQSGSSMRYKEEIKLVRDEDLNPENLYKLNVWQFKYRKGQLAEDDPKVDAVHIGLLAEEVKQYYPIAAQIDEYGYAETWEERYIIPPMLQLIKNQHEDIEKLKQQVNSLMEGGTYERETN